MKIKEILPVAVVAIGVFALAGCAQLTAFFSSVNSTAPQLAADVAALCKVVPDLSATAQATLKGGAANEAAKIAAQVQSDCNGAVVTAPSVLSAINTISTAVTAAQQASQPAAAPASK